MDITERRKAQDGSFRAEMEGRTIDFRVATQGLQGGEKMVIRILDKEPPPKPARPGNAKAARRTDAGHRQSATRDVPDLRSHRAGKSTTLYAALQEINAYENNIITVEDPVEYKMPNVTQIEINSKAGQNVCHRTPEHPAPRP